MDETDNMKQHASQARCHLECILILLGDENDDPGCETLGSEARKTVRSALAALRADALLRTEIGE